MERTRPLELRAAGRRLSGPVIRYGETASDRAERFAAGSLASVEDPLEIDLQHDPAVIVASTADGAVTLSDGPLALEVRATLPEAALGAPGSAAGQLVERGALRGWSAGFHALAEHRASDGTRVIDRFHLARIGLVDEGSYAGSRIEFRARMGRSLFAQVPTRRRVACECAGPGCKFAELQDDLSEAIAEQVARVADEGNDVIAVLGDYKNPLASASSGTLRARPGKGGLDVEIDLPDDDAGRAVIAAQESAGVIVRPYLDDDFVTKTEMPGGVIRYGAGTGAEGSPVRAFIVSSTDRREGWPMPKIAPTPDLETRASGLVVPKQRRALLCL